jgi:hypothetical protein
MTEICLENLQGWVSADWDKIAGKNENEHTALRAKALGAPQ